MKKFRTLLIDDERLARVELRSMLDKYEEIEIIGEAENGEDGIAKIKELSPDLIFLDISMPGMTGFEMIKRLEDIPRVIFVTAFDEFALKAFDINAMDYILKPVENERLQSAIEKLKKEDDFESVEELPALNDRQLTANDRIFIKDGEKTFFVKLSEVRLFESDGNYVKIHFGKSRPLILRSLNSFEKKLDSNHFFRINRKFIVNLDFIVSIENWFNGGLRVELTTGEKVEVSRRQAIRFKEVFGV